MSASARACSGTGWPSGPVGTRSRSVGGMPCCRPRLSAVTTAGQCGSASSWSVAACPQLVVRAGSQSGCSGSVGCAVPVGGEHGGGGVPGDAPPDRRGLVFVRERAFGGGGAQQGGGVGAGPGQGGEVVDQGRPVRVAGRGEPELGGQGDPGGAVAGVQRVGDPLVEGLLGAPVGGGLLAWPGGSGVLVGDGVGGPEHGQVGQQRPVLRGEQLAGPGWGGRWR